MADYGSLKNYQNSNFLFQERKMFVCLELWQKYQYFLTKHVPLCNQSIFFYACNRPSFIDLGAQTCLERTYCDIKWVLVLEMTKLPMNFTFVGPPQPNTKHENSLFTFLFLLKSKKKRDNLASSIIELRQQKLNKEIHFGVL